MEALTNTLHRRRMLSRRKAIHQIMLSAAAISMASCAPLSLTLNSGRDPEPGSEATLRAFLQTVVPGTPEDADLSCYTNQIFGFDKYVRGFTDDLNRRSENHFRARFAKLGNDQRQTIIKSGLEAGKIISMLYTGAVFLTQIAVYTGMTNQFQGCPLIDFDGNYQAKPVTASYSGIARSITTNGHPN